MRWVPHDRNPADALTKHEGAHVVPLMQLLRTGHYKIQGEAAELEARKQVKTKLGYFPKLRHGHDHETAKESDEHLISSEHFSPGTQGSFQDLPSGDWTEVASADQDSPKRQPRGSQVENATQSSATTSSSAEVVLYSPDRADAPTAPPEEEGHVAGRDLT